MKILEELNEQQKEAVSFEGKYLLVIAGAGSGKTRVLTRRIAYILEQKRAQPNQILAITFTNKAAKEMRERIKNLIGTDLEKMWICTFHAMCVKILRIEHKHLGINSSFSIYDTADVKKLIKNICANQNISTNIYPTKEIAKKISDWKNNLITPEQALKEENNEIIANIYKQYQEQLKTSSALDFDDLISETVFLFKNFPQIAEKYHKKFKYVLVDEYQDTNYAQYVLVKSIVEGTKNTNKENRDENSSLTVVGDSDQSIYAFRGATIRNIDEFEQDFPNTKCIMLEQNYRSTENILKAANSIIAQNENRREKNLWSSNGKGDKITLNIHDNEYDEAANISRTINSLLAQGYRGKDIAIFYRTNSQSGPIETELTKATIQYNLVGGTKFYDRKEIKDALSYMHLVANPDDITNFFRIVNEPKRGIGHKTQNAIVELAKKHKVGISKILDSLFGYELEQYGDLKITKAGFVKLREFWENIKLARKKDEEFGQAAQILMDLLEKTDYLPTLRASNDVQDQTRIENLAQLESIIEDFISQYPQTKVIDFLENTSLMSDSDKVDNTVDLVTLMTVHTSKGLEFPVVFITGMEEEIFPHQLSFCEENGIEEERRLAYVALTRAGEKLFLSRVHSRTIFNVKKNNDQSRFLDDLPEDTYITIDYRTGKNRNGSFSTKRRLDNDFEWNNTIVLDEYETYKNTNKSKGYIGKIGLRKKVNRQEEKNEAFFCNNSKEAVKIQGYDFEIGDKVRHKTFGDGIITGFEEQKVNSSVTVKFKNGSIKKVAFAFQTYN